MDQQLIEKIKSEVFTNLEEKFDPSHDRLHIERVFKLACLLQEKEGGDLDIIIPASLMHDYCPTEKDSSNRKFASQVSADEAVDFLASLGLKEHCLAGIHHAIVAHSFSAKIEPKTLEAKIVQDADRLDALGSVGIGRTFSVGARFKSRFYHESDPWGEHRELDDRSHTLDHFFVKLLKLADSLQTKTAKELAIPRMKIMKLFLDHLKEELRTRP